MFCKFFWESHAILPDISLAELESFDDNINMNAKKEKEKGKKKQILK
jgi:hypothetical protein